MRDRRTLTEYGTGFMDEAWDSLKATKKWMKRDGRKADADDLFIAAWDLISGDNYHELVRVFMPTEYSEEYFRALEEFMNELHDTLDELVDLDESRRLRKILADLIEVLDYEDEDIHYAVSDFAQYAFADDWREIEDLAGDDADDWEDDQDGNDWRERQEDAARKTLNDELDKIMSEIMKVSSELDSVGEKAGLVEGRDSEDEELSEDEEGAPLRIKNGQYVTDVPEGEWGNYPSNLLFKKIKMQIERRRPVVTYISGSSEALYVMIYEGLNIPGIDAENMTLSFPLSVPVAKRAGVDFSLVIRTRDHLVTYTADRTVGTTEKLQLSNVEKTVFTGGMM